MCGRFVIVSDKPVLANYSPLTWSICGNQCGSDVAGVACISQLATQQLNMAYTYAEEGWWAGGGE